MKNNKKNEVKKCSKCKKHPRMGQTNSYCNPCMAAYMADYREGNQKLREYNTKWALQWYHNNKDDPKFKKRRQKIEKRWRENNPERVAAIRAGVIQRRKERENAKA